MSRIEQIEGQIQELTPEELQALRAWFEAYDARRLEAVKAIQRGLDDVEAGRVRDAREALEDLRVELGIPR